MAARRHTTTPAGNAHPAVREYLKIKRHRGHGPDVVAAEGLWSLRHALDANAAVDAVFVCWGLVRGPATHDALQRAAARGADLYEVSEKVLRRLVDRDGPDGVAAMIRLPRRELTDLAPSPTARVVVIDGLDLPGNIGTIIRAADGAGAMAVVITSPRVRITNPTLLKASMGTILTTPVIRADNQQLADWLVANRFTVIAAHPGAERSYRAVDYAGRVALVVGNERTGLSAWWHDAAHLLVSIPMLGVADSLNVGHATALLLYEALHRAEPAE